ncbi:hypothetical protein FB45DRAFT_1005999 [Roridomyces roridus]|uniref:F-box domain-containing protein n=1 Tax=Roridomyces roridus TaxID=1738132 RepID=A0AAD7FK73_9AGAR|nr:hypothetical protein FB45DRAFT_1005999 [Roridomyces roridus]
MPPRKSKTKPKPKPTFDLPTELHSLILTYLPYYDLLRVVRVSKQWKTLIENDPVLRVLIFKEASEEYVAPCKEDEEDEEESSKNDEEEDEPVRMHTALPHITFILGDEASSAHFDLRDENDSVSTYDSESDDQIPLHSMSIYNDLASIPAVHTLHIELDPDVEVEIKNPEGVTLRDIFTQLETEMQTEITTQWGVMTRLDAMSDHVYYGGFSDVKRQGKKLSVWMILGS